MEIEARLEIEILFHHAHLELHPFSRISFVEPLPFPDYLVGQERRRLIKQRHLHLAIGVGFQICRQCQHSFEPLLSPGVILEQHSNVHIAEMGILPARRRAEEVGSHHIGLLGEVLADRAEIQVHQNGFSSGNTVD